MAGTLRAPLAAHIGRQDRLRLVRQEYDISTAWVRDNALALRYVARALAEGDEQASRIFDALVEIARRQWLEPLARQGALAPGVDRDWAAIHVILFNMACVLLEPAVSRQLPAPLFTPEQLQRWNVATTELHRRALGATPPRGGSRRGR